MPKRLIKNSILKYSNLTLFERREKQYKYDKKFKTKTPKIFKVSKLYHKKVENTKENTLYQFCQTMSSFHSSDKKSTILPLLDYFENDKKINKGKNYHKLNINNKSNNKYQLNKNDKKSKTMNNFYMTEISPTKNNINRTVNNISSLFKNKKNKNKIVDLNIDTLLTIQTYRTKEKNNNINNLTISSYFPNKKQLNTNSFIKHETSKKILGDSLEDQHVNCKYHSKKNKISHSENPKIKEFIKKIQEFKSQNNANKIKREREIRLEEGYYNQIEFYQDTMNSLQSAKKLLDVQFSNKIADYTRFVITKREREIVTSSKIMQEILNHKKEIEHIKTKISKIEIEKNNILKWIYFMIQMKEKLLVLPSYYKMIIEKEVNKRLSLKPGTRREEKNNSSRSKAKRKSLRKSSYFFSENLLFNNKDNKVNKENKENKENKDISEAENSKKEEYEKILKYRNELIFQTPEEFQDRLLNFQKENLILLNYNNELNCQLFYLKKELNEVIKDKDKMELRNNIIISKIKELDDIKNIAEDKMRLIADFKRSEEILEEEYKKEREKGMHNKRNNDTDDNINELNNNKNIKENKKALLYRKINILFEECKIIGCKLKFSEYIFSLLNKKAYTKEKEMTLMLEYVEQTIDYLINSINYYMNQNKDAKEYIKKVKFNIEKEHKIDKAKIQMMLDIKKIKLLKEKIEKRSNKIYFLQSKRLDLSQIKRKKEIKIIDSNLNKIPTIDDYLYNENKSNGDNK